MAAESTDDKSVRVVQITDSHLYGDPDAELLKMNTQDSFERVLERVAECESGMDLILATGDIAQDASPSAYQRFVRYLQPFRVPFYWIPGNHDRRSVMAGMNKQGAVYREASRRRILVGRWQILMLDSSVPGEVHGYLSPEELDFLDRSLADAAADADVHHTLVCLHHNPHTGTATWMEGIGLRNADELLAMLAGRDTVRAVLHGHIHQTLDYEEDGIRFLCTPSTCIQFKPGVTDFTLDDQAPAYRWLELLEDGRIETGVERIPDFEVIVDHDSGGY
ncbi:MAG: 3',5'-cyclic-AMP phosphodiesterase [Pseudohongiellaceae bacterium]